MNGSEKPGFKRVRGFLWPEEDQECRRFVFQQLSDLDEVVKLCPQRRVAIQAGGNCGVWPARLAETFDLVYSFEPDGDNYECLAVNTPENVWCIHAALGDGPGGVSLKGNPRNCGAYQVVREGIIPMMTIDSFHLEACDLIQLDIEGMEFAALKGAEKVIEKFGPVIMIEEKGLTRQYGAEPGTSGEWLRERGYEERLRLRKDIIYVR